MTSTIFALSSSTCLALGTFHRCQASKSDHPIYHLGFYSKTKLNRFSVPDQKLALRFQNDFKRKMNMAVFAIIPEGAPLPPIDPSPAHWKAWVIGTIVTILLSFSKGKWGPLLQLRDKIQITIDEAERVADIVEDVAERVEKVADVAAENLPEGKLHDAVEIVGKVAENIDMLAENAGNTLEKAEEMEKELESFIESTAPQGKTSVASNTAKDQKQRK